MTNIYDFRIEKKTLRKKIILFLVFPLVYVLLIHRGNKEFIIAVSGRSTGRYRIPQTITRIFKRGVNNSEIPLCFLYDVYLYNLTKLTKSEGNNDVKSLHPLENKNKNKKV